MLIPQSSVKINTSTNIGISLFISFDNVLSITTVFTSIFVVVVGIVFICGFDTSDELFSDMT